MVELIYVGKHTVNEIVDVPPDKVAGLIARGDYELKNQRPIPHSLWKEKQIKEWIVTYFPEIKYDTKNMTKVQIFKILKDKGLM